MAKNLIVSRNPAGKRKARRSPAQKAASKRNIKKAQAARRGGRRRTTKRKNPTTSRSYARRSNPKLPTLNRIINNQVIPAMVGGGGAVLNDLLVNMVPIPEDFKAGYLRHVSKAVGAIAIGYIGAMFLPKNTADQLGAGAMTVVGYNVVREAAARFAPQLPLGEYLPMGEYLDPALGYYGAGLDPSDGGLDVSNQFTRGTPYIDTGNELNAWPTGAEYEDMDY